MKTPKLCINCKYCDRVPEDQDPREEDPNMWLCTFGTEKIQDLLTGVYYDKGASSCRYQRESDGSSACGREGKNFVEYTPGREP